MPLEFNAGNLSRFVAAPSVSRLLAFVGGMLLTLAFAPFGLYPLATLLLALLLWLWQGESPRDAAWVGGLFGLGMFGTGIYWIYISLHDYGNAPAVFAAFATLALVLLMAMYIAVTGYLLVRWRLRPGPVKWLLVAPALWTLLEWVRSWLFSGFSWLSLGYSQIDSPLNGIAPYLGVFGVSWAVLLSAGLLLLLAHGKGWARFGWASALLALWTGAWGLGQINWVQPAGKPLRVTMVQGNISQDRKWRPEALEQTLALYTELSVPEAANSDLIIWPETAIPTFYENVQAFVLPLEEHARRTGTDYLTGVPAGSWDSGILYNSIVSLGSSHGFYHKRRLVPFGEYLPLRFILDFFHQFVDIPMADFTSGDQNQPLLQAAGHPVGASICFEAAFGSEIRRSLPEARFLVNVSNDAWFGNSLAPHQHLEMAQMRALEAGRYMARATNTGISALIDTHGRIIARSNQFVPAVLRGQIQPLNGATPYVRFGDLGTVVVLGALLGLGLLLARRR